MASVDLDTVYLADVATLGDPLQLEVSDLAEDDTVTGDVRLYANGRLRSVTRTGVRRSVPLTFDVVADRDLLASLRAMKGRTLLARDPYGRKLYCVFYILAVKERIPVDVVTVSLTLQEITFSEAV